MDVIDKITAKSSRRNRIKGQIKSFFAAAIPVVLYMGLVTNPFGIAALLVGGSLLGISATKSALKVGDESKKEEKND